MGSSIIKIAFLKIERPLSDAERQELSNLRKEVATLRKGQHKATNLKQNDQSTRAAAPSNKGCFKCGKEGQRQVTGYSTLSLQDRCPDNKSTPTSATKPAAAKSVGQSGKKVSFTQLHFDSRGCAGGCQAGCVTACEYSGRPPDTNSHQPTGSLRPELAHCPV